MSSSSSEDDEIWYDTKEKFSDNSDDDLHDVGSDDGTLTYLLNQDSSSSSDDGY